MAASIEEHYGLKAELIPSGGGVFEVVAAGELIFSKKKLNRFPEEAEIFASLDKLS